MNTDTFDFDEWSNLAKSTPDIFEQRRRDCIERLISDECKNTRRLRGLQCRIDMERMRARTPLKACLRMYTLMWDSFLDLHDALDAFVHMRPSAANISPLKAQSSQVILFRQKS